MEGRGPAVDPWGIQDAFEDALGHRQVTPPEVRESLRRAMGSPEPMPEAADSPEPETAPDPGSCPPPPSPRSWGFAIQLYSLRSSGSWGMGDLADLRRFGAWSRSQGARFLQVNPLMTAQPVPPVEPSPYFPGSRRFPSPLYLRIEEVPGFSAAAAKLADLTAAGRALNACPLIERDEIFRLKREALEILWAQAGDNRELDRFVAEGGAALTQYATYCVLAEAHGPDWRRWPAEHRHPASPAVSAFAETRRSRVAFHQWVQWLLDLQMRQAAAAIPLLHDLPIGFDPGGLDAWAWQDLLALEAKVGAPPDEFNRQGQDWGLPPFIPHRLRAAGYAPLRQTLRAVLRHAGGLRIDHVMGLFRLYWIPPRGTASAGAYVRYRHEEMLAVLAEESRRARTYIVGEDLGTVEPGIREALSRCGILGSRVLWFEKDPPSLWPPGTFASVSTHDLPTVAGLWSGADAAEQAALGLHRNVEAMQPIYDRLKGLVGLGRGADKPEVARKVHRLLAESGSSLIAVSLEDAIGVERRPNLPGTVNERPNWRIPLPIPLEAIEKDPLVLEVAAAMDRRP